MFACLCIAICTDCFPLFSLSWSSSLFWNESTRHWACDRWSSLLPQRQVQRSYLLELHSKSKSNSQVNLFIWSCIESIVINCLKNKLFNRCKARVHSKEGDSYLRDIKLVDLCHNHEETAPIANQNSFFFWCKTLTENESVSGKAFIKSHLNSFFPLFLFQLFHLMPTWKIALKDRDATI